MTSPRENARRRHTPRFWDTDWLVLRELKAGITAFADSIGRSGDQAVDFGCGTQPYRAIFETRGIQYRGADLGRGGDIAIAGDGRVAAPDGSADLVLSFQVLEHVRDLDTYLAEARRLLKPGGSLILSTHGTWLYHPHPQDHRRWTREGLIAELAARGLTVQRCESIVGPLAWTTLIRLTSFAYVLRAIPMVGPGLAMLIGLVMNGRAWIEDKVTPTPIRVNNACVYLVWAHAA